MSGAFSIHQTPLGIMRAEWTNGGLFGLWWGEASLVVAPQQSPQGPHGGPPALIRDKCGKRFDDSLKRYFSGDKTAFEWISVAQDGWTPFFREVYLECLRIPFGQTRTYQQLAEKCGRPSAARAVGQAMARNRVPLVIPCHRVLGSNGGMGGYSGPGALVTKRELLWHERSGNSWSGQPRSGRDLYSNRVAESTVNKESGEVL